MNVLRNLPWDEYRGIKAMNASTLVHGIKSMKQLHHAMTTGTDQTPAMLKGTQLHSLALEPEDFERTHVVVPTFKNDPGNVDSKGNPSTSANTTWCREALADFARENAGRQFIDQKVYDDCLAMIRAVHSEPCAAELMATCEREVTLQGVIEGVPFKGRCDLIKPGIIADIKSTPDVDGSKFGRSACNLHYGFKVAIYRELARQNGYGDCVCDLIAVETVAPHDVCVYRVPDGLLDDGWMKVVKVLSEYRYAKRNGEWYGVSGGNREPLPMVVPNWAMPDDGLDWSET